MYGAMQQLRFETFFKHLANEKRERVMSFATGLKDCFPEKEFHDCVEIKMMGEICDVMVMKSILQSHQASLDICLLEYVH